MNRREVSEFLVKNEVGEGELMKFRDEGDQGCVAIAHNGMKYRFTNEQLIAAEPKMPKPKPTRKPTTRKPTTKTTTKKTRAKKS